MERLPSGGAVPQKSAQNEKAMLTTLFSSSSLVSGILFGILFAWLLASAAMTMMTGIKAPRMIPAAPEKSSGTPVNEAPQRAAQAPPAQVVSPAAASAPAAEEGPQPSLEGPAPLPLTRGRRAPLHADPETASIAASAEGR